MLGKFRKELIEIKFNMFKRFLVLSTFFLICYNGALYAQFRASDSARLTQSLFTKYTGKEGWGTDMKVFVLVGGNMSKQAINTNGFQSNLIYNVDETNADKYKLGMLGGINVEGSFLKKNTYSILLTLNQYNAGTFYKQTQTLKPLFGSYSTFKAADQFLTVQLATMYKLALIEKQNHQLSVVLGPSIEYKIEKSATVSLQNTQYNPVFILGVMGAEYTFAHKYKAFVHYKQNLQSLTPAPINIQMNALNMGVMLNVSSLF